MSERSERVGRPSDAPPTPALATVVAAERATTTPPQDPPAPTIPQRSWPVYEGVRVRPPTTSVVGELDRERLHPEREDSPVSVEVRRGRRVLRSGGSGRSRGSTAASTASAALATVANALTAFAHEHRSYGQGGPASDGTVLLCRSGSRSPAAVASLHRQAPTLLRRCGAGLAQTLRTGSASPQGPTDALVVAGDRRRRGRAIPLDLEHRRRSLASRRAQP